MKLGIDKKVRTGYMTAFVILFISYCITFFTSYKLQSQSKVVQYTSTVINSLENLLSGAKDAQRGVRGFLISGKESFLTPYHHGLKSVDSTYNALTLLLSNERYIESNKQLPQLQHARATINTELALLTNILNAFKAQQFVITDSIKNMETEDQQLMNSLEEEIKTLQTNEDAEMSIRIGKLMGYVNALQVINIVSLIIAVLLSIYSLTVFMRENRAKQLADITAEEYRQQLEARVKELDKTNEELKNLQGIEKFAATGRIARTIAHEVRNPLTNINLAAEQIEEELEQNDESKLLLGIVNRNTLRINQLITDLLNSTKFAMLNFTEASINTILNDSLELAADRLSLKHIEVVRKYQSNLQPVYVDDEKLRIAFLNIIVNAIEAMKVGEGKLIISTASNAKNKCVITIEDNGAGIEEEHMQRLFEPYFTNKMKGTGLGLTNTQNIILNHKGSINVESEPGKGSRFIIQLDFA